jgi:glutamyl-tRNA synthetase
MTVRTRFAPSPTGYLHIGGARTALFSWAYARRHQGEFILRIEDTDIERSTPEAVQAILDGMAWLNLSNDGEIYYQMKRMDRYAKVIETLLESGLAYYCYSTKEELDLLREQQMELGLKPKYDGKWRPEPGKVLPPIPSEIPPVIRFKNPQNGTVEWHDLVKGHLVFSNDELDDFIIARSDGTPTYNFCVVVDDWEMNITHVIRGDDHVNNTPRQINLLKALGANIPQYAHLSMILGDDGQKLSKRHGAVSVMQYHEDGYLPEAVLNYLARLGWSHGDDEIFSMEQFCEWFDLDHITASAAQFNTEKLRWLNAHYIKEASLDRLTEDISIRLAKLGVVIHAKPALKDAIDLYRDRAHTLNELAQSITYFYQAPLMDEALVKTHVTPEIAVIIRNMLEKLTQIEWSVENIALVFKDTLQTHNLKMPQLMMPLRVLLTGGTQSPSVDRVMYLLGIEETRSRIFSVLK